MKPLLATLLCLTVLSVAKAQPSPPAQNSSNLNIQNLVTDCTKSSGQLPHREMVIWIPARFWEIVGDQMKIPPETVSVIVKEMAPYMMFCVVDYSVDGAQISFKSAADIRSTLKLVDSSKHVYRPLDDKDVSPVALKMIAQFQPLLAKFLGQFGDGMRIFMFDGTAGNGKPAFEVDKPNHFLLTWDDASAKWSLPLASVLPAKHCPVDNEIMPGNWNYCPFHGAKLL
ncbi:MAG TPA: hypothetical protein VNW04_08555 [Puia sp.]|nr:hypothetical protein [Puia sp.]